MVEQYIEIWTGKTNIPRMIEAVQNDSGRIIKCVLMDHLPQSSETARIYAEKPSGKKVYNNCTISENVISVELTTQILAETGKVNCQVELLNAGKRITSFEFIICVKRTLITDEAIESFDETTVLEEMTKKTENAEKEAREAAGQANTAAGEANKAAGTANEAAGAASTAAGEANKATDEANKAAKYINDITVSAEKIEAGGEPTAETSTVEDHLHIKFGLVKGDKGDPGEIENLSQQTIEFTEAEARANIESGEDMATLMGKIKKNIADFDASAFTNDTAENIVTFDDSAVAAVLSEPEDREDEPAAIAATDVKAADIAALAELPNIISAEKHKNIFKKIHDFCTGFIKLCKFVGSTDISTLSDGTITGVLNQLNSDKADKNSYYTKTEITDKYDKKSTVAMTISSSIKWQSTEINTAYKKGSYAVELNFSALSAGELPSSATFLTIPDGYRPTGNINTNAIALADSGKKFIATLLINKNGSIQYSVESPSNLRWIRFHCVYLL